MGKFFISLLIAFTLNLSSEEYMHEIPYEEFLKVYKKNKNNCIPSKEVVSFIGDTFNESSNKDYWGNPDITIKTSDYRYEDALKNLNALIENPKRFLFSSKDKSYTVSLWLRAYVYMAGKEYKNALEDYFTVWNSKQKCYKLDAAIRSATILQFQKKYKESNNIALNIYKAWKQGITKPMKPLLKYYEVNYPLEISSLVAKNYLELGKKEEANKFYSEMIEYQNRIKKPEVCEFMIISKIGKARATSTSELSVLDVSRRISSGIEPFKSKLQDLNTMLPLKSNSFSDVSNSPNVELPEKDRFEKEAEYRMRLEKYMQQKGIQQKGIFLHKIDSMLSYDAEKEIVSQFLNSAYYLDYKSLGVENYPAQNAFNAKRDVTISKSEQNRLYINNTNEFLVNANYGIQPTNGYVSVFKRSKDSISIYSTSGYIKFPLSNKDARKAFDNLTIYLVLDHSFGIKNYRDEDPPTYDYPNKFWKKGKSLETKLTDLILYDESKEEIVNFLSIDLKQEDFDPCKVSRKLDLDS